MNGSGTVSVLFRQNGSPSLSLEQPDCFPDLNLDQIVAAIIAPKQEYDLAPFFYSPLREVESVLYRQEVMRDLENETLLEHIKAFAAAMSTVHRYLAMAEKLDFAYHQKGWVLEAALLYCDAVMALSRHLATTPFNSRGLSAFREYLERYLSSPSFQSLAFEARKVKQALGEVQCCVIIEIGKFRVKPYEGETEYSIEIEKIFEKFKQSGAHDYITPFPERNGMTHIDAKMLEFAAKLFPEPFAALDRFYAQHVPFLDATIQTFEREIQFYVAYLDFIAEFKRQGLPFCYPQVSSTSKEEVFLYDGFDLALAHSRAHTQQPIVLNDFSLQGAERILVVTGPNQGGKTTFARMFGQVHYLASLGCPVPGREAHLFLFDHIFTHFERAEEVHNLRGKLEDDLVRLHTMLSRATSNSIFILNEIFTSTTVYDALFLSKEVMNRLIALDVLAVWVTFLDELAALNEKTVSMVALVDAENPAVRMFRIVRMPANGLAYALSLARKYRLTYAQLRERLSS
ncbi:MAG: MutS-related protein [Anaerolineales bacterium]